VFATVFAARPMNFTDSEYEAVVDLFVATAVHTEVDCKDWLRGMYRESTFDGETYACAFAEDEGVGSSVRVAEVIASTLLSHGFRSVVDECYSDWRRCWTSTESDTTVISLYRHYPEGPRGLMVIVDPTALGYLLHVIAYPIE